MKIDDILTLIKAVSDSELTELELTVRREEEEEPESCSPEGKNSGGSTSDGTKPGGNPEGQAAGGQESGRRRYGGAVLETFRAVKAPREIIVQTEGQAAVPVCCLGQEGRKKAALSCGFPSAAAHRLG